MTNRRDAGPKTIRELYYWAWNRFKSFLGDEGPGGGNPDPNPPGHLHDHRNLVGRGFSDQHPMSAITGLIEDQQRQDDYAFRNTRVFFQLDIPDPAQASIGDIWVVTDAP